MSKLNWQARLGGVHRARIGWVEIEVAWRGSQGGYEVHCQAPPVMGALASTDLDVAKQEAIDRVLAELKRTVEAMEGAGSD